MGIPGLIHAYRESTARAIAATKPIVVHRKERYLIDMPIALEPKCYAACKQYGLHINEPLYTARFTATLVVPMEDANLRIEHVLSVLAGHEGDAESLCKLLDIDLRKVD